MTEVDHELRKVTFELPKDGVPALLTLLGDFALENDISLHFSEGSEEIERPGIKIEERAYNPSLVTWVKNQRTRERAAIVTKKNMCDFAHTLHQSPMLGARTANAIFGDNIERCPELTDYCYIDEYGRATGIRADRAHALLYKLERGLDPAARRGGMLLRNMGARTIRFYARVCEELYLDTNAPFPANAS